MNVSSVVLRVRKAFEYLGKDALLYMQERRGETKLLMLCCIELVVFNRDYRMNILVRFLVADLFLVSSLCDCLLFYMYGSTISRHASIDVPLRFSHARSVVIGGNVKFEGPGFAYVFNNVTLGKSSPMVQDRAMPVFFGKSFFGIGSVVLGRTVAEGDVVFGANSFISNKDIPPSSSVFGHGIIKSGVFFEGREFPFVPLHCARLSRVFSKILTKYC